jgi:hypothetical protein
MISVCHDSQRLFRFLVLIRRVAIWDNRSVFHSATFDYEGLGERFGNRAVGIGEVPYFDPNSRSRTEYLAEKKVVVEVDSRKGLDKSEVVSA